ncbi:MAG TPA: energy-coupling factor transporter ATPase [Clostridiales bacterium]|nr:energy-coupling factor transporter ATPase [Clostridiales bacterium]
MLEVKNITYVYGEGTPFRIEALKNISVTFEKGELIAVIGHTGSGKSTLLMHLNGLLKPTAGKVLYEGKDIWESKKSVKQARFNVGYCFQYPEHQLFESSVQRDIAFGPRNMGLSEEEINLRVQEATQFAGIDSSLLQKSPFELSGGEKRRVAIAGVMAMKPGVLILDEPTAGLDPKGKNAVIELIKNYNIQTGSTVIFVSHNMDDVASLADRVLILSEGQIVMYDTAKNVFSRGKQLASLALGVPEITQLFLSMGERGFDLPVDIFDIEEAKAALLSLLRRQAHD